MARESFLTIVEKMFQRNGGLTRLKGELAVYYWPRIAGNDLASKVEAVRYYGGTLFLQTDNPALAHQLTFMSLEIVKRYQKVLGRDIIKNIKMKIAPVNIATATEPPHIGLELAPGEIEAIEGCVKEISDPELAGKFSRMMKSHQLRSKKEGMSDGDRCQSCGVNVLKGYAYCPCCERQLREEIKEYQRFLKTNDAETAASALDSEDLTELHQILIQAMLKEKQG